MFDEKLQKFLSYNDASRELFSRLNAAKVFTIEDAWNKVSDEDLIWVVTRPGVMNPEQRRLFLVMVLSSIENKLTDPCSKNILTKLRANETITEEDRAASDAARAAAGDAASDAAWAAAGDAAGDAAGAAQAKWVRENFNLCDLHTK